MRTIYPGVLLTAYFSFLSTIRPRLSPLPAATKRAKLIFRDQNYVSQYTVYVYMSMSIHSVYPVSGLEGSDNDNPSGRHYRYIIIPVIIAKNPRH
jgi:hypothetical protein